MREMSNLDLHADLVVLSGCDTARGDVLTGEGVIGMSWALFSAGCPTTVVSQWKAMSRPTTQLMIAFHKHLHAGEPKAVALRHARLELMKTPAYHHPFYWAPFVMVGEGEGRVR
jgi:CHAT domain-containing protein